MVTSTTGTIQRESDYYPYGGEQVIVNGIPNQNYKFTGKERDSESGLDNFGARYHASVVGLCAAGRDLQSRLPSLAAALSA